MGSVRDELMEVAAGLGLRQSFSSEVLAEVAALERAPGIDDPALVDRTGLPFVTIDAASSRDLDQALYLQAQADGGTQVAYAIADAAYFVRPGTQLFAEALARGATYYFPGFSIPMLPRELSEGLVSLNPDGPRRALLFWHELDATGELRSTRLEKARIRSRAKLSFAAVQQLLDSPDTSPLRHEPYLASLRRLELVGRQRQALAQARGLVRYRREEVEVRVDGEGVGFTVMEAIRDPVEGYNEQLSLMCNAEGGRLLKESGNPAVQPVYRVQEGPDPDRLKALAVMTETMCQLWRLPAQPWAWRPADRSLNDWLAQLPPTAPTAHGRIARALARQAVLVNLRSSYAITPGPHAGVGAEPYARFSAPMRELVGVYLHKEATELLTGQHPDAAQDELLRAQVVTVANEARQRQKQVQNLTNEVVLNRVFASHVELAVEQRPTLDATVMGISAGKVHVQLDTPPLDVKLYFFDVAKRFNGAWLEVGTDGCTLRSRGKKEPLLVLGQHLRLTVAARDPQTRRWQFDLQPGA